MAEKNNITLPIWPNLFGDTLTGKMIYSGLSEQMLRKFMILIRIKQCLDLFVFRRSHEIPGHSIKAHYILSLALTRSHVAQEANESHIFTWPGIISDNYTKSILVYVQHVL